jgi:hypothetical protein
MESLKEVIMRRDSLTSQEADEQINEAKQLVLEGFDPEEVMYEMFSLEPDYVFDILPF